MPISLEMGKIYYDQIQLMIEQGKGDEYVSDYGITKDKRTVIRKSKGFTLYSLSCMLHCFVHDIDLRRSTLRELSKPLGVRVIKPKCYAEQHIQKLDTNQADNKVSLKYAKFVSSKFPHSGHKVLSLGVQNTIFNAYLEYICGKEVFREYVIPVPVSNLKHSVELCVRGNSVDYDQLNEIFGKIIPEKIILSNKKLVIARQTCDYITMCFITKYLEGYLKSKEIEYCFALSIYKTTQEKLDLDHFEDQNKYYLVIPGVANIEERSSLDFSYLDSVIPADPFYLENRGNSIWHFPENPLHHFLADYIENRAKASD